MEQAIEQSKERIEIEFGGVVWKQRENNRDFAAQMSGDGYCFVGEYENGTWNWQRHFDFDFKCPEFLSDCMSGILPTREDAMQAALQADAMEGIKELCDTLAAAGFLTPDEHYRRGLRDGRKALKAEIMKLAD